MLKSDLNLEKTEIFDKIRKNGCTIFEIEHEVMITYQNYIYPATKRIIKKYKDFKEKNIQFDYGIDGIIWMTLNEKIKETKHLDKYILNLEKEKLNKIKILYQHKPNIK